MRWMGALVIPDARRSVIERKYAAIRRDLPRDKGEVKGRYLNEAEIDRVVRMLLQYKPSFTPRHSSATSTPKQKCKPINFSRPRK
jgi:hypothetical protein